MANKNKDREKKKVNDDDEVPMRQKVREFVEGKYIIMIMTFLTLFALFGDDFRLWFFNSGSDPYFFGVLTVSLVLFALEILINAAVLDDFKYSFFFWLDIIATLSLIPDIDYCVDFLYSLLGIPGSLSAADVVPGVYVSASGGNEKLTKIVKSLRLIRLIRIIKLYKYLVKSSSEKEEARMREQQKLSQNAQQAALKRELEPSRLGSALSDTLTRRLIIGVLCLLMVLPAITYNSTDTSHNFGLRQLFWTGRSNCADINGEFLCEKGQWISDDGWNELLRQYVGASRSDETAPMTK